ncbi:MAG: TrkH family potassium uptake protein [Candidatus Gastranaerophilales bacterium]
MRLNYLANAIGLVMIYIGLVILAPIAIALYYKEFLSILPFLTASMVSALTGYFLRNIVSRTATKNTFNDVKKAEALFIVAISWIIFGIVSAIPYLFYGLNTLDALFESVSGITTTGATILSNFDYPHTMFFWRSLTQWLGGLGIIVLFIAVLPQFAVAGRQMFFAEAPGPTEDKFTPRIRNTASALWKVYAGLTILEIILLKLAGMPAFDALCNSLSTLAAGGFSTNPQSIMGYNSVTINWIVILFMFLAGASFNLQYKAIVQKNPLILFKSDEFKTYLKMIIIMTCLVAAALILDNSYNLFDGITHALYQVISLMTSTGSSSANFVEWNLTAKILLFSAMFMGACASSAGGGIKMIRWVLIFKTMKNELVRILHPNAIVNIKIDNVTIQPEIIRQIIIFVLFYITVFVIGAMSISIIEQNLVIGLTSSITSIGNVGPGFGQVIGPMGSFTTLHVGSKCIMIFGMLIGRLELIPFLVFLQRDFWSIKDR